jgi:hypothetical protein
MSSTSRLTTLRTRIQRGQHASAAQMASLWRSRPSILAMIQPLTAARRWAVSSRATASASSDGMLPIQAVSGSVMAAWVPGCGGRKRL